MKPNRKRPGGQPTARPEKISRATPLPDSRNVRSAIFIVCALIAITWIAFGQALRDQFVNFDDDTYVQDNPIVNSGLTWESVVQAFTQFHADNWHPLTWISHMLDCQLFGLNPPGHHFTSIVLHTLGAVLLFLVLKQATGSLWPSAFVAAVFAVHPLRVESVVWIAERKDVLSGVFFMLTIAAYIRYVRHNTPQRYGLVVLLFALGLMCKPMLVTLPVILLLLDYWPLQRWQAARKTPLQPVLDKFPLLALSAASCVVTWFAQTGAIKPFDQVPLSMRAGNAIVSCLIYIGQMFWPSNLVVLYPFPARGQPLWEILLSAAILFIITAAVFVLRKSRPYLLVGWLWYLVMLLPVIGLLQVGAQAHADRYTYLPQIGLCIALAWLGAEWCAGIFPQKIILAGTATIVLTALLLCTRVQITYWQNSEKLWTHALAGTTDNFIAQNNLGTALFKKGDVDGAIGHFQTALKIKPDYAEAHCNLGDAWLQTKALDQAINEFQTAIRFSPNFVQAYNNLAYALVQKGDLPGAITQMQKAVQVAPDNVEDNNNLAWILATTPQASLRDGKRAVELARHANELTGGKNLPALRTLAAAYAEAGRFSDAIRTAQSARDLANASGHSDIIPELDSEIKLYQAGQPLHTSQ